MMKTIRNMYQEAIIHGLKSCSLIGYGSDGASAAQESSVSMRLHLLSRKVILFGLPAIVLLLPILVNPFGARFFEIPKVAFLRFTVLLVLTVWLVDRINLKGSITGSLRQLFRIF